MPVKTNREYRNLNMLLPKTDESNAFKVSGYAMKYEPYVMFERDGVKVFEEITKDAIMQADMSDIIMQYDHSGRVLARQSNKSLKVTPDERGLFIEADLSGS